MPHEKIYISCGTCNGWTKEQSEFISKVKELAKEYGELTLSETVRNYHDHTTIYECETLGLTIKSMRDSS